MKQLVTDFKNCFAEKGQKSEVDSSIQLSTSTFNHKQSLCITNDTFKCNECDLRISEEVIKDFLETLPDQKLTCPFCLSLDLDIMEVAK